MLALHKPAIFMFFLLEWCVAEIKKLRAIIISMSTGGGGGGPVPTGGREVFSGSGDPNGVITPDDETHPALYQDTNPGGELWYWDENTATWK